MDGHFKKEYEQKIEFVKNWLATLKDFEKLCTKLDWFAESGEKEDWIELFEMGFKGNSYACYQILNDRYKDLVAVLNQIEIKE